MISDAALVYAADASAAFADARRRSLLMRR